MRGAYTPRVREGQVEAPWREPALARAISWVLVLGSLVAALTVGLVWAQDPAGLVAPSYASMMLLFAGLLAVRYLRMPFGWRATSFVAVLAMMGAMALLNFGLAPGPFIALCLATVSAGAFLGRAALLVSLVATTASVIAAGWLFTRGLVAPVSDTFVTSDLTHWIRAALEYALFGGSVAAVIMQLVVQLERREVAKARAQRLEALGRLAGGVAHDFNNALQVIFVWRELLADHEDDEVREAMDEIHASAEHASRLTAQLLAFGRRDIWSPRVLDLREEVERWTASMRRMVPEDVVVTTVCDGDPTVRCDPGQIEQILLNLVINARDALDGAGHVDIQLDEIPSSEVPGAGIRSSRVARLRVRDDGPGMTAEVRQRVFEPFFSTKKSMGTGLGLSIVYAAVQRAGGIVQVASEPGEGAVFTVYLPCIEEVEAEAEERPSRPTDRRAEGVILLAEDEPLIRRSLASVLRGAGYTVLEAEDGDRAMETVETHQGPIDVLCTDGVMPGVSTRSVIARFRELHPEGRVLLCSGHVEEELMRRDLRTEQLEVLPKPFAPKQLLARLQK